MTLEEARYACERQRIIVNKNNPDDWGIPTVLSDDESTIYYRPKGMYGPRVGALIESMRIDV